MKKILLLGVVVILIPLFSGCIDETTRITPLSIVSFEVKPNSISQGEYVNLSWVVLGANSVSIDNGIGNVTLSGNRIIKAIETTTYILTASNSTTTKSSLATITVTPPVIAIGDCADVNYICRYASNSTILSKSDIGIPMQVYVSYDITTSSPKLGYSTDVIEGFMDGLIGMEEGETKTIGPIPPEKAYGKKFTVGSIFITNYLAFGMNQTVQVTKYTSEYMSVKWIGMETLGIFTMPQFFMKNLSSHNESDMVVYPPPYHIWEKATSIISINDDTVTVKTTPTKSNDLSTTVKDVRYGEKQMLILPDVTTASWNETKITITSEPIVGKDYVYQTPYYTGTINVTIHINTIIGDKINVTVTNDQNSEPQYLDVYKVLTFNRTYTLPRYYSEIPSMYISYIFEEDIEKAGYSFGPLAGETLIYEVEVVNIYKTSIL